MCCFFGLLLAACSSRELWQLANNAIGREFVYEDECSEDDLESAYLSDVYICEEALKHMPSGPAYDLLRPIERMADFEHARFAAGQKFVIQHDVYLWDATIQGAVETEAKKYLALNEQVEDLIITHRTISDTKIEKLTPALKIKPGTTVIVTRIVSFSSSFVPGRRIRVLMRTDDGSDEFIFMANNGKLFWLKPKPTAQGGDINNLVMRPM